MKNPLLQKAVVLCALALAGAALFKVYALALILGIVAGAFLLLRGMASGGSIGNARQFGQGSADHTTRIGLSLAAAGIAAAAIGREPPFPLSFRVFYGVCLAVGCVAAIVLALRPASE